MSRVAALALLGLVGCGPSAAPPALPSWADLGALAVDASGSTPELRLPWKAGQRGQLLEISASLRACFQVDQLTDDDGHSYIGVAEPGPHCLGCEQRTSVAAAGGLFAFPSRAEAFTPAGALRVRLGVRDCDTLTRPTLAAPGGVLKVRARAVEEVPPRGTVALRLIVTPASVFHLPGSGDRLTALLAALNAELAPARLEVTWSEVTRLPSDAATDGAFSRGDPSALTKLLAQAPVTLGVGVPVVLAGCLRFSEPVLGTTRELQGYTPHIPGGAGPADGIFLQGSLCGTPGPVRVDWSSTALARVLAHELGHYLGLYHSVEADGSTDQLEDTTAANLMFHLPGQAGSTGLSPGQGEVVRAHPSVRPPAR